MERSERSLEYQIEKEPKINKIVLDLMRHGETDYLEEFHNTKDKVRDLTPKGEEQIRKTAYKIINTINPETDLVVLWSSPAWRAQGSEELILEILEERGIPVYRDSTIEGLKNFTKHNKDHFMEMYKVYEVVGKPFDAVYAKDPAFQEPNEKFEVISEVKRRAEKFFYYVANLAKIVKLEGKTLRIIGVTHFEFLNPIMEELFGHDVAEDNGIKKGEDIHFEFIYDLDKEELTVNTSFRNEEKKGLTFNTNSKKFVLPEHV